MIQMPRRSVTRFFIPLIDVLTLLFCIFLLMPMVRPAEGVNAAADQERLRQLEEEIARLRKQGQTLTPQEEEELKRLRQRKDRDLEEHLLIRVLQINPDNGTLFYADPEPIEIRDQAAAQELIDGDRRRPGAAEHQYYYLILFPRPGTGSGAFPQRRQVEEYDRWFAGVPHGWDTGKGPAHGGTP